MFPNAYLVIHRFRKKPCLTSHLNHILLVRWARSSGKSRFHRKWFNIWRKGKWIGEFWVGGCSLIPSLVSSLGYPRQVQHVGLAETTADIVKEACQFMNCRVRSMRDMCWRRPEDPRNTGVEADASFYVGAKADQWYTAYERGRATVDEFEIRTTPDLVVEVEITHLDQDKPSRYVELGVQEMWQANPSKGKEFSAIEVVVLDLQVRGGPREIRESLVIPGINAATLPKAY